MSFSPTKDIITNIYIYMAGRGPPGITDGRGVKEFTDDEGRGRRT
mgnify:CR=1 FL=1